jgi:curved DNA-binding protein CbpA
LTANARTRTDAGPEPDHYQLLGVPPGATVREITRAYREAMKRTHPDRVGPAFRAKAEERAKELNAAYRVLINPERRRDYDASIKQRTIQDQLMSRYAGGFGAPGSGGVDIHGAALRREQSPFQKKERRRSDRDALVSILVVFGGATALVVGLLVVAALVQALARAAT